MRPRLLLPCLLLWGTFASNAATITGVVNAQGKTGADLAGGAANYDSRKFKFAERINYAELRDFVVYIEGTVTNTAPTTNLFKTVLTQKDATFLPHVLPVSVGTTVEWPNKDEIYHNAFSFSEVKPFDLGLYKNEAKKVMFDKPGRVDVFCSIHANMHCVVLVLENPYYAQTDAKGRYIIKDAPPGTYKLKAWHERLPPQSKEIIVSEQGEVKVDFTLGIANLPQY